MIWTTPMCAQLAFCQELPTDHAILHTKHLTSPNTRLLTGPHTRRKLLLHLDTPILQFPRANPTPATNLRQILTRTHLERLLRLENPHIVLLEHSHLPRLDNLDGEIGLRRARRQRHGEIAIRAVDGTAQCFDADGEGGVG